MKTIHSIHIRCPAISRWMYRLYFTPSTCSLVVHIVLNELELPHELVHVELGPEGPVDPSYAEVNPFRRIPTLHDPEGRIWTETLTIVALLARKHPALGLWPGPIEAQLRALEWMGTLGAELHASFRRLYRPEFFTTAGAADEHAQIRARAVQDFVAGLEILGERLAEGDYCLGSQFSVVDPYFYVILRWARLAKLLDSTDNTERLRAFAGRIEARAAVRRSLEREGIPSLFT